MSHPNETRIRTAFSAFIRGDAQPAQALFDPDVVTHVLRHGPSPGDLKGIGAFLSWGAQLFEKSGGTFKEELLEVLADENTAFQRVIYRATRGGRSIEDQSVNVYRFRGGRIVECWVFFGNPNGFDDFWS